MRYKLFAQNVMDEASNNVGLTYSEVIDLLKNPDNFILEETEQHSMQINGFLKVVDMLFGKFAMLNSYDHVQMLRSSFLSETNRGQMKVYKYLRHISGMQKKARKKLNRLLDDIDSYAFLALEKAL